MNKPLTKTQQFTGTLVGGVIGLSVGAAIMFAIYKIWEAMP